MVLEKLGSSLRETLRKIAKSLFVDEKLVNELIKDIQKALLYADVNVELVFELTEQIKKRALKERPPTGVSQREHLIRIVYEELVKLLGEEKSKIEIKEKPFKIMFVGLFGSGKTTTIGKLARYYAKKGYKVATVGLDVHRPAAPEQLEQISKKANVQCFIDKKEKDPLKIWNKFKDAVKKFDILLIDTAGRDALSKDLIKELENLHKHIKPQETLLVISADIGQAAKNQAEAFHKVGAITGIVITKMDSSAKAGGALTACAATGAKVKFIGTGEKLEDIEEFNPKGFVSRLLGMGDLEALLSKTEEVITKEKAEDLKKKFLKGEFNLIDLYEQMEAVSKMGPISKLLELIPGMSMLKEKLPREIFQVQEEKLKKWKYIMQSMTVEELENPEILNSSRIERIAKGSGTSVQDVRELIKQYKQAKKLMKLMKGTPKEKDMEKMLKKLKLKGKLPF